MSALRGGVKLSAPIHIHTSNEAKDLLQHHKFSRDEDYTIGVSSRVQEYRRRTGETKTSVRWGQLKLMITEIQFLTLYWDPAKIPEPQMLYVGAAPGTHIPCLADMFPKARFHLYDPRAFDAEVTTHPNIVCHRNLFFDKDAHGWKGRSDVFLLSDIRSEGYTTFEGTEADKKRNEELVAADMETQKRWVGIIDPVKAHLKFRLPYDYDFTLKERRTSGYLDGRIYIQSWAPQASTETRLVTDARSGEREYDIQAYNEALFHHNSIVREGFFYETPFEGPTNLDATEEWKNDYDCVQTLAVLGDYLRKFGADPTLEKVLTLGNEIINRISKGKKRLSTVRRAGYVDDAAD